MIGENGLVEILKKQFADFLSSIEKYGLSHDCKMDIYTAMQSGVHGKIIDESIEYGRKIEREHNTTNTVINRDLTSINELQTIQFTADDELVIESYMRYFLQNGVDTEFFSVFPLSEKDEALINEARRRIGKPQEDKKTK